MFGFEHPNRFGKVLANQLPSCVQVGPLLNPQMTAWPFLPCQKPQVAYWPDPTAQLALTVSGSLPKVSEAPLLLASPL